jgi:UDP-N-acetylmuramyl pentapeptide phosphotransferase/UDP-N-acetylglucosamine-1-phosphate transferase
MSITLYLIYFLFSSIINFSLFFLYQKVATKIKIIDNSKKFNNPSTVTAGGIIFYLSNIIGIVYFIIYSEKFTIALPNKIFLTFFCLSFLVLMSFFDDIKPIDAKIKLSLQLFFVYLSLVSIKITSVDVPLKLTILFCLVSWVYIINITNFIDGSDGFLNTQIFFTFLSVIFISHYLNISLFSKYIALILLPSVITFIYFNKPQAKIYFGDTGSIFFGFISGFIFLELFILKFYLLAISIIIYPLTDCTLTLIKRIFKKQMPWTNKPDYYFSKLQLINVNNKYFIFKCNIIFQLLNFICICLQILFSKYYFILNIILVVLIINIYNQKKINT